MYNAWQGGITSSLSLSCSLSPFHSLPLSPSIPLRSPCPFCPFLQASAWNLTSQIAANGILTHDPHQQSPSRSPRTWRGRPEDLHHQGPERTQSHDLRQSLSPVYSTQAWSEATNGVADELVALRSVTTLLSIWRQQPRESLSGSANIVEADKAVVVKQGMASAPVVAMITAAASLTSDTRGKELAT